MNWKSTEVLVTGAGGFIGSRLTEKLVEEGARTRALVHYNSANSLGWLDHSEYLTDIEVYQGDIRDQDNLKRVFKGVDVVFHLAALIAIPYSYHAPMAYVRTNVEGTLNVLQVAMDSGVEKVVHTSTSEVYGTARYVPIDEEHPLQGQSPYSASKIGADKIAESIHRSFEFPTVTIRPFNTYGPRQSARAVLPTIITQALTSDKIRLGNLEPTRDLNFVDDTVSGFILAGEKEKAVGETINIGSGREISIGGLADLVMEIIGNKLSVESESKRIRPDRSEVERLCSDNKKAKELIGWRPQQGLRSGLLKTIEWIEKNIEKYRPEEYAI